jgi:ribosome-binding factor A
MQKKNTNRSRRVATEIKRILSEFFIHNSLGSETVNTTFLSVTDVVVSSCLQHVKVYIAFLSDGISVEECVEFLREHTPHLRRHIGAHVRLKFVPEILFFVDDSFDRARKIESLLDKCRQ